MIRGHFLEILKRWDAIIEEVELSSNPQIFVTMQIIINNNKKMEDRKREKG